MKNNGAIFQSRITRYRPYLSLLQTVGLALGVAVAMAAGTAWAASPSDQSGRLSSTDQGVIQQMLKDVADTIRKDYYDSTFQGADLNAAYRTADQAVRNASSVHEGYEAVAGMTEVLKDSHTLFLPPQQPFTIDQGWDMQLVGDKCLVTRVKKGSDAEAKGLKAGDQVAMVDGVKPSREVWQKLQYELRALSPRSSLHLVVISPGSQPRAMVVASKVTQRRAEYDLTSNDIWWVLYQEQSDWHRYEPRSVELDSVMVWKFPIFGLKEGEVDGYFRKASKYPALIIDLRGNPGGLHSLLIYMVGSVFDHDVKIADAVSRDKTKPVVAKSHGAHAYKGKVILLVDNESMSASEIFARVIQLEKRGTVIGDHSAGEVREAQRYRFVHGQGIGHQYAYGVEVTIADLKMTDGKSLENVGVTPDEIVLPTSDELAAGADPQLARALQLAGNPISAEKAGTLFPPVGR